MVTATRDDLVGEYVGHTAPKTKEIVGKARGGVLFVDEAYYLHRPGNERDYGGEAIEILLQAMEDHRDDLVVVLAGYADRMATFFEANPGMQSRVAHHVDFPDFSADELVTIAEGMVAEQGLRFSAEAHDRTARVPRAAPRAAVVRGRPQRAQRARPRPDAPGPPPRRRAADPRSASRTSRPSRRPTCAPAASSRAATARTTATSLCEWTSRPIGPESPLTWRLARVTTTARLRAFVALADHGSVRAAASARWWSPSPPSPPPCARWARRSASRCSSSDGRGVRLTPAGARYAGYARRILGLLDEAAAAARGRGRPRAAATCAWAR